ncbi:MAG: transposase [Bacteroidales bacterium]|nr:transposase [Bacteroidales bacterium]
MTDKNKIHNRKSIRLKGYDYSQEGLYFITICTHNRECLFGEIANNTMILNNAGKIANQCWLQIPHHFPNTQLHQHIIMPNHIHGIIEIVGANNHSPDNDCTNHSPDNHFTNHSPDNHFTNHSSNNDFTDHSPDNDFTNHSPDNGTVNWAKNISPLRSPSKTIGSMVRGYKIGVTKWFRENMGDLFPVGKSAWQRNYWEHIIRNEKSYINISEYIINNPTNWKNDKLYN